MSNKVSGVTFIRNNYDGAFCLWESMATLLPVVDDMIILDMGSTDGTWQTLCDIAAHNPKVRCAQSRFTRVDASAFADAANACVQAATHNTVLFWQADEIWHPTLLKRMKGMLDDGADDLTFWRVQLKYNWQHIKWFPHPVHRVGRKDHFQFVDDGMNTSQGEVWGAPFCAEHNGGWFTRWGAEFKDDPTRLPTWDMIMDVSQVGGFLHNILRKRQLHSPMWHEPDMIEQMPARDWLSRQLANPDWTKTDTPFDIPPILRRHLGRVDYILDQDLLAALKHDTTAELVGYEG